MTYSAPMRDDITDPNLMFQYHFDEVSGSTAADSSKNHNDCVLFSSYTVAWVTGLFGNGLFLDGGMCKSKLNTTTPTDWTLAAWIKPRITYLSGGDSGMNVIGQWPLGYSNYCGLRLGKSVIIDMGTDGITTYFGATQVSTGTWHFICAVRRSGIAKEVWLDGQLDGTTTSGTGAMGPQPLNLGRDENGQNMNYSGIIDEAFALSRAATPGEIQKWYTDGFGRHVTVAGQ